jgi:Protein of unknown function (DUF1580)
VIDILKEQLLSLDEASRQLHGRPHRSSLDRWIHHGVRGRRLETVLIGGRRYTSQQALQRFVTATSAATE